MPPKTRGGKFSKASKENLTTGNKSKTKATNKSAKLPRKALGDKTNSASDDNASFLQLKSSIKNVRNKQDDLLAKQRPRRERRVPNRFIETTGLHNLSSGMNTSVVEIQKPSKPSSKRNLKIELSPLKTTKSKLNSSLAARRPKRICRLPSKFDDHSVSPSKFVPVQPAYASTPKVSSKNIKQKEKETSKKNVSPKQPVSSDKAISTKANKKIPKKKANATPITHSPNSSADTNNNAKNQLPPNKTKKIQKISPKVQVPTKAPLKKVTDKNFSFKILEDKNQSLKRDASNLDVYEFTYDPNEEPPAAKKKRKRPPKKREPKPKTFVFKSNYDKNLAKALAALKNTVTAKSTKPIEKIDNPKVLATQAPIENPVVDTVVTAVNMQPLPSNSKVPHNSEKSNISMKNYNSVRVEDIALDFEPDCSMDDVNFSPVHSPCPPSTSAPQNGILGSERTVTNYNPMNTTAAEKNTLVSARPAATNDPLNLRDDLSFFDDQPVASSSMNVSHRNPEASPWRVEFGSLPIKWQVNTYMKPNMTPAFESSFINFNESKKKHVYTNIVPDTNEENDLPHIYDDNTSKLKQTSIISFIKEVVEKNAKKKKHKMTPIKANTLFEDLNDTACKDATSAQKDYVTPKKNTQNYIVSNDQVTPPDHHEISNETENETDNSKDKENSKESVNNSSKKKKKKRDKDVTYFGFDETGVDQENVSPNKKIDKRRLRALKPRSRAVLQEINAQRGPTRAILPVAVKSKPLQSSETANRLFDQMKSANEPPVFPDKEPIQNTDTTNTINITEVQNNEDLNDDQSVHLFEDIELMHHLKAHRKSYGKAKKAVVFRQNSMSDSDVPLSEVAEESASSEEDDLHDLTFKIPASEPKKTVKKKKSKKPKLSKKEEQEVEAWAAGFNSMCEDIEEFDLVLE